MTAAGTAPTSKVEPVQGPIQKLRLLKNRKIYYSDKYIFLDPKEFTIVWHNVFLFILLHYYYLKALYGIFTFDPEFAKSAPVALFYSIFSGFGVTAGAHRLYAHQSYKAKLPLRIFFVIGHIIAGQNNLVAWCRDHRVHHKFSDTDADPHNTNRGFFFAHMGWLMFKKHPDVLVKGSKVDLSDLERDPVIRFQRKWYYLLFFIINLMIPISLCMYFFDSTFYGAGLYCFLLRYATTLHATWFVNSAAHMFGDKPYNEKIRAVENNWVSFFSVGEGYHNYHHAFPFDYATSEFCRFNLAKSFIDFMARRGLAYNLKRAPERVIEQCKLNVNRRLESRYGVWKEVDINNQDIQPIMDYAVDEPLDNPPNDPLADAVPGEKVNDSLIISDEELRAKIDEIKNGLHQPSHREKIDQNNNIVNNLLNENSQLLKER